MNSNQIITQEKAKELEMLFDFFKIAMQDENYEIEIPQILSINKTDKKFVKNQENNSFILAGELSKETYEKL